MKRSFSNSPDFTGVDLSIFFAAAVVAFLLSVMSVTGSAANRLAVLLRPRLGGEMTIAVWGWGFESADAAAARAMELLAGQPGVRRVVALEPDVSDPVVGDLIAGRSVGLDGPRLLSVGEFSISSPSASRLRKLLIANRVVSTLDDHRGEGGALEHQVSTWIGVAAAAGSALCGLFFIFCFIQGRIAVATDDRRFDLMVRLGASPSFIGAQIGGRSGLVTLAGALSGVACAVSAQAIFHFYSGFLRNAGWPPATRPELRDSIWDAAWLVVLPAIAMIGGYIGAQLANARRSRWA